MRSWTKRSDDATERAFLTIFEPRRFAEDASARIGIAQLLLKLAEDGAPARDFDSTILTKRQVDLAKEAERMLALSDPRPEDVAQVLAYAKDTKEKFPYYHVRSYIVYICANKGWKCWEVTP